MKRALRKTLGGVKVGRYSDHLPKHLAEDIQSFREMDDDTKEEESVLRWMLAQYMEQYSKGEISFDQLYTNFLVGAKTLSEMTARRQDLRIKFNQAISPEDLVVVLRYVGDVLNRHIHDVEDRRMAAADIAAFIRGNLSAVEHMTFRRPAAGLESAVEIIDQALPR